MHPLILIRRREASHQGLFSLSMRGRYVVELIHARTGFVKRRLEFDNLITDAAMNALAGTGGNLGNILGNSTRGYLEVGTGSTPPSFSDIGLESSLAGTTSDGGFGMTQENPTAGNGWISFSTMNRLFGTSEANGNLTEVGVRLGSTDAAILFSRALFLDESDQPTTIVKTSEDQLRISWTLFVTAPFTEVQQVDYPIVTPRAPGGTLTLLRSRGLPQQFTAARLFGTVNSLGVWESGQIRAYSSNSMPAVGSNPAGTNTAGTNGTVQAYVPDSLYREIEWLFTASQGNLTGGIGAVVLRGPLWSGFDSFITTFDPKVDKTNVDRFVFRARFQLARA